MVPLTRLSGSTAVMKIGNLNNKHVAADKELTAETKGPSRQTLLEVLLQNLRSTPYPQDPHPHFDSIQIATFVPLDVGRVVRIRGQGGGRG